MPETGKIADPQRLSEALRNSATDPIYFFEEVLGEKLDDQQREMIRAFPHHRRMAVKSGHSNGKDFCAARLGLLFHLTHYPSIVVFTGPTDRQVRNVVWGELKAAYRKSRYEIGGEMLETLLKSGDPQHYMIGFTANSPEAFQGFHSENVLVVVTEAPGVEARMWPGIESLLTSIGNAKLFAIGNATYDPESEFYAMFTRNAALYKQFTLDSRKSSYCSKEWLEEMKLEHGEDGPVYQARVLGIFPTDVADTLIPLAWIERAYAAWSTPSALSHAELAFPNASAVLGVDVARFGSDQTVFMEGKYGRYRVKEARQGQDLMETAGKLVAIIRDGVPAASVRVDDTGLGGGVTDRLREQGYRVTAINFGSAASDPEKFANARSEMFWTLRERFRSGDIAIDPADTRLLRDLSVLKYKMTSKGQIKLEEKSEAKRRLGYSPDRADALALAALPQGVADQIAQGNKPGWGMLEIARQAVTTKKAEMDKPVGKRNVRDVPGAAEILEANRVESPQALEARARAEQWRSVYPG